MTLIFRRVNTNENRVMEIIFCKYDIIYNNQRSRLKKDPHTV